MEEAAENGKELSHFARGSGMDGLTQMLARRRYAL
jgi:hypothetical protein